VQTRLVSKKKLIVTLLVMVLITISLAATVYALEQYKQGQFINRMLGMLVSSELSAAALKKLGYKIWTVGLLMLTANVLSLIFDSCYAVFFLWFKPIRTFLGFISQIFREFAIFLKVYWKRFCVIWKRKVGRINFQIPGSHHVVNLANHVDDLRKNPSKIGLVTIFMLGLVPKIPIPYFPGFMVFAVLAIRYNKLGWRGWAALIAGMLLRIALVLFALYF
jgi:hypothetical protein